ncbi:MAG: SDR family NAD(P)-dependent oxidoreductase [Halioglobus sp.]|nr:SDR family NAD(P)-dependent oxidoreductase [Halioglobus sp.]
MSNKVALVTGASRGIGKQAAIMLAAQGFDVAITARTMDEGEVHEHGASSSDVCAITGSLRTTAAEIEKLGQQALPIRMDLLDPQSIELAVDTVMAEWKHIDVLLNNGIYQGPGIMNRVLELTPAMMQKVYQGNVFSQLLLVQRCLPPMLERNSGCVINMVSASGMMDPPAPTGEGGWGFAYASSKAAFLRMVGILAVEHRDSSVQFFNVDPGFIITEVMQEQGLTEEFTKNYGGAPPTVPAAVIAWLATSEDASPHKGTTVSAQSLCKKLGLVKGWPQKRDKGS